MNPHRSFSDVHATKFPLCEEPSSVNTIKLSPQLAYLFEAFRSSPFTAAPERASELKQIVDQAGMRMRLDARAESWRFEAMPTLGKRIFVGTRTLERLWAYSYAFTTIISEIQYQAQQGTATMPNPNEFLLAFASVAWADQQNREDIETPWPDRLPDPSCIQLEYVKPANEFFLMTSGRILLHEIAHVIFAEKGIIGADPKEEELDADKWADQWMLDKWRNYSTDERVFVKRCLGIALAHAPAIRLNILPEQQSRTHPSPIVRIVEFFNRMQTGQPSAKRRKDLPAAFLWMILLKTLNDKELLTETPPIPSSWQEAFSIHAMHYQTK